MPLRPAIVLSAMLFMAWHLPGRLQANEHLPEISLQELGYHLRHWTVDDGLPSAFIFSVAQTPDGAVWASTLSGVARCDGRKFTSFLSPEEGPRLFHRPILHVDDRGRLWSLSLQGGMVVLFENGQPRLLGADEGLPSGYLQPIPGNGPSLPYLQTFEEDNHPRPLITRIGDSSFGSPSPLKLPSLTTLIEDPFDAFLIARTHQGQLIEIKSDQYIPIELPASPGQPSPEPLTLFKTSSNAPAILTRSGVYLRDQGTWKLTHPIAPVTDFPTVMTAGFDWHGHLWILSPDDIFIVQKNGSMRKLMPQPFDGLMRFFFVDREGSIWLPTRQGLYQLTHAEFTSWQIDPEGRSNTTYKATEDGEGRIWVSGQRNTFFLEPDEAVFRPVPGISLNSINVQGVPSGCYIKGAGDHLWFATPDEVKTLPETTGDLIYATRDGVLWTGNPQGLVRRPSPDSPSESIPFVSESGDGVMTEDSKGQRFLTVRGQGIFRLDGIPEPMLITPSDGPIPKRPNSIMADPDDNIWFVSRGPHGLGYWNPRDEQWHFATWVELNIPFPIPINLSLNADREGGFWVITTSGVLHCDRAELMEAIPEKRPVNWRLLQKSDGLPTIAASFHNQGSLLDSRGRVWIPTDGGIAMTDPARWKSIRERVPPPPVIFTGMRLDNEDADLSPDNTLTIAPGEHLLELDYKALHYADPDRVSYRYRLLGFEDDWALAGSTTGVRYQKLPHGTYRFEVTADNGFGNWSKNGAILSITVLPQWWERTSLQITLALALLAAGVLAYQRRVRSLQKAQSRQEALSRKLIETQESERQRLSRELHDGLGQNLLVIKNGLALEAQRIDPADSPHRKAFLRYADAAKECLSEARQMSQDLRPHQIDRLGLTVALESVADRLSETSHVPIHHEVDDLDTVFPPEDEIHLLRIIQESLGNAIRHSDASEVKLRVQNQPDAVHLTVSDDGKGFHIEETRTRPRREGGLGLISIEERARMLGGTCRFSSAPGEGTCVEVHIPKLKNNS